MSFIKSFCTSPASAGLVLFSVITASFVSSITRGMMMAWRLNGVLIFAVLAALVGCGGGTEVSDSELVDMAGGELSETVPVSGTITIDGTPTKNVVIYAYNSTSGMEAFAETKSQEDGTYCWSTYKACDGIAPGEYKLAFAYIPKDGKVKPRQKRMNLAVSIGINGRRL
ncbi:MAG: hypothetical protein R3B91_04775 [Planctomycetaceae bacterium]